MIGILKDVVANIDKDFFAIHDLNLLSQTNTAGSLFCTQVVENFPLPIKSNMLQKSHMFNFNGILITDDLMESQNFIHSTYAKKRFLYLYHLEWPYINNLRFGHVNKILLNENIELIARSPSHADLIEKLFKKPKYIMPEWDYKILIQINNNE